MNSVAVPAAGAVSGSAALSSEADLVRQAARGHTDSFGELFRRHSAPGWRLAQAVAADRDAAISAFRDGFVKALRSGRSGRRTEDAFRPALLAGVYRAAIDQTYDRTSAPSASRRPNRAGPDAALTDAAFRSLPERWRAAVWLREVERYDAERIAVVLGVSATVAEQLVSRGHRGLVGRFAQAERRIPDQLGDALRPLALAEPSVLAGATESGITASGAQGASLLAPVSGWLEDRAMRPLGVAVGTLVGLGLIALGVVPGGTTVRAQLGESGNGTLSGAVPVGTCSSLSCPAPTALIDNSTLGPAGNLLTVGFPGAGGALGYSTGNLTGGSAGIGGYGSGGSTGGTGTGGGTSTGGGGTTKGGSTTSLVTVSTSPTGVLGTPTVGVTTTGGQTLTINCNGVLIQATTCPTTTTTTTTPTTTTTTPLTTVVGGATSTLNAAGSTITSTVTTILSGVTGGL